MNKSFRIFLLTASVLVVIGALIAVIVVFDIDDYETTEEAGLEYIIVLDARTGILKNKRTHATWEYQTNLTDYNNQQLVQVTLESAQIEKEYWEETMKYDWSNFENEETKRMFDMYSILGTSALPDDLNQRLLAAISTMQSIYSTATICDYQNSTKCDLHVEPEVTDVFAKSQDPEELKHTWVEWHRVAGGPSKQSFIEYAELKNEAARLSGYDSVAEWWLSEYETSDSEDQFAALWEQIKPLYLQMHAYVRRRLRLKYGDDVVSEKGPLPAHLLGNIWAQSWINTESFTKPFPDKPDLDIADAMVAQGYTVLKMFQAADDFFVSLNLTATSPMFWEKSIFEKPEDRDMICHASAWDFFDGEDFRIRQCSTLTTAFFKTTHHEMGHIQYFLQYKHLPNVFRTGANPGFHEAVADVPALSVATPKHLRKIGLLEDGPDDLESIINQVYTMGLDKIVFLPFAYLLDIFRYGVFRGLTTPDNYNCHFWQLRESIQGVEPPVTRTEEDFDPAAKYHIAADVEYMRYYVSYIIQFQFHEALCKVAGEYDPNDEDSLLSNCDIYNSTAAGEAFSKMLQLGASKPWPDAMEVLTGQRDMDATGVLGYFQPLYDWLKEENELTGEYIGWEPSTVQYCTSEQKTAMKDSAFMKNLQRFV